MICGTWNVQGLGKKFEDVITGLEDINNTVMIETKKIHPHM